MKKRTICSIPCQVLVISEDWSEQAYSHKPFGERIPISNDFRLLSKEDLEPNQHLIHLAQNWDEAIISITSHLPKLQTNLESALEESDK